MTDTETIHRFAEQNLLVEKYLLGELGGADLEDFELHVYECPICFQAVKAGLAFRQSLRAGVSADEIPSKSLWQRIKEFLGRC